MTWGHDLRHFRTLNHLKLSKHVFLKEIFSEGCRDRIPESEFQISLLFKYLVFFFFLFFLCGGGGVGMVNLLPLSTSYMTI